MKNQPLHLLLALLQSEQAGFVEAVFSGSLANASPIKKVRLRPLMIKGKQLIQSTSFTDTQTTDTNRPQNELSEIFRSLLASYRHARIRFSDKEYTVQSGSAETVSWKVKELAVPIVPLLEHNRKKAYILPEGEPQEFLIALGVMNKEGRVYREKYDKFKQINRFLEIVLELLPKETDRPLCIVDFGCGKAYLTFALYSVLKTRGVQMIGIDRKEKVMQECNALAARLGYQGQSHQGLTFVCGDIAAFKRDEPVDLVLALHACDTATDAAIAQACRLQARAICVAPCCQHELLHQIKKEALPLVLKHGLLRERFSALVTDALRSEILEQLGYKTDLVEFIDPEHTPKNLLIRAVRGAFTRSADWTAYRALTDAFGLKPTLEKLLL